MSTASDHRISEDLRYELADAARVAESRNRPRGLLVMATLLFLIAGLALIVTLRQHESAVAQQRLHNDYSARIANYKLQFAAIEDLQNSGQGALNEHINDLFTRIEIAAATAGVQNKPAIPRPQTSNVRGGAIKILYPYSMQDPSLQNLLAWVEEARASVPGLEVASLKIVPAAKAWKFNVTFVRWERPS